MLCVIPAQNMKGKMSLVSLFPHIDCIVVSVFGRAVHALAKIGEDLYVEPQKDGLAIRTINGSRWAFSKKGTFGDSFWNHVVF